MEEFECKVCNYSVGEVAEILRTKESVLFIDKNSRERLADYLDELIKSRVAISSARESLGCAGPLFENESVEEVVVILRTKDFVKFCTRPAREKMADYLDELNKSRDAIYRARVNLGNLGW